MNLPNLNPRIRKLGQVLTARRGAAILGAIRGSIPGKLNPKTLAQLIINVFQNMNATPPGVAATLGLLIGYGLILLLAVVIGSLVLAFGQ